MTEDTDFPEKRRSNATQRIAYGYIPSPDDPLILIPDPDMAPYIVEALDILMQVALYERLLRG